MRTVRMYFTVGSGQIAKRNSLMTTLFGSLCLLVLMIGMVLWDSRHGTKPWMLPGEAVHPKRRLLPRLTIQGGLLLFTAVYALAFVWQYYTDDRPYLVFQALSLDTWEVGKPSEITVTIQNIGKTPAYHFNIRYLIYIEEVGKMMHWEVFPKEGYLTMLAQQQTLTQGQSFTSTIAASTPLSKEAKDAVEREGTKSQLVVELEASYIDAFWIPRHEQFCQSWNRRHSRFGLCQ
jgi:hypothetical protein